MSLIVDIHKKLDNFDLDVQFESNGEILALFGSSGCGKSMTLKCIAGIEKPDSGLIVLDDKVLFDSKNKINLIPQKRSVGYLFQQYALFPNMTVAGNIEAALGYMPKADRKAKVEESIKAFHLEGLEDKKPYRISGGQQQRVALARIMASDPQAILLDEPFSALDSYLKRQLQKEMRETLEEFGKEVLFVSHDCDEVEFMCKNVCVIQEGKSKNVVSVKEFLETPYYPE